MVSVAERVAAQIGPIVSHSNRNGGLLPVGCSTLVGDVSFKGASAKRASVCHSFEFPASRVTISVSVSNWISIASATSLCVFQFSLNWRRVVGRFWVQVRVPRCWSDVNEPTSQRAVCIRTNYRAQTVCCGATRRRAGERKLISRLFLLCVYPSGCLMWRCGAVCWSANTLRPASQLAH